MVTCLRAVLGLLILQIYVSAAPNNITVTEPPVIKNEEPKFDSPPVDVKKSEQINSEELKLDSQPLPIEDSSNDDNSMQNQRQKRFYDIYGYSAPAITPFVHPSYYKRDQSAETGVYGLVENPLDHIHKRLQDIASFVRQPAPPPPPPAHFPFYLPVIYIPQYSCDCNPDNITPQTQKPITENPQPQTPKPGQNQSNPDIINRGPPMDDGQNWGLVTNESDPEYDEDEFRRPISFTPLEDDIPAMRPPPPVDHGSSQDGSGNDPPQATTTVRPPSSNPPTRRPLTSQRLPSTVRPSLQPDRPPYPASFAPTIPRSEQPSACDGAVLSCCHQPRVTYDCFVLQGCPDPTSYGNPCDPPVIFQVIEKFQKFYGVRNGKK